MKNKRKAWKPDSPLARKMSEQLKILDRSERTVASYLSSIRLLANFYQCSPGRMSEQQVRDYLLDCKSRLAHNSMRGICAGIKFFYTNTCPRDWKLLRSLRVAKSRTVPQVLNADEIGSILSGTPSQYYRTFFSCVYGCGLRQGEARRLKITHIDGQRMQLTVRGGKGRKDRCVPMPQELYRMLQQHWKTHRNGQWLFPSREFFKQMHSALRPISERAVQRHFSDVVCQVGIQKDKVTLHTLRHSYATHLLDEGVNLRVLQQYLGHTTLQTTEVYLHLTTRGQEQARDAIEGLFRRGQLGDQLAANPNPNKEEDR